MLNSFKWSWTAGSSLIISIVLAIVVTPPSVTMVEFYRSAFLDSLLMFIGISMFVLISREEQKREATLAEMITGGENFCYLSVDPKECHIEPLPLWIDVTGLVLDLTYHIYPAHAEESHGGDYQYLNKWRPGMADGGFVMIHKSHRIVKNELPTGTIHEWIVAFTARSGGWKQYLTLVRTETGYVDTTKVIHDDGRVLWPPHDSK